MPFKKKKLMISAASIASFALIMTLTFGLLYTNIIISVAHVFSVFIQLITVNGNPLCRKSTGIRWTRTFGMCWPMA